MENYNEIYGCLCSKLMADRENTVFEMVQKAARELFDAVQKNHINARDLYEIDYHEICDWLDWPYLRDGGIFEQAIDMAADMVLSVIGFKPRNSK